MTPSNKNPNRLFLVRHGENKANLTKQFSHRLVDFPLTEKGFLQAQQTAALFYDKSIKTTSIHAIYSSPLKRARLTAEIIAASLNLEVVTLEHFREVNVGQLEQQPPTAETWAIHKQIMDDWYGGLNDSRFPGGEDYTTLWDRMHAGLLHVVGEESDRNIIVVGHGGIFTATLKNLCPDVDVDWLRTAESHNCAISEILVSRQGDQLHGRLITWATHDHLHGPAADLVPGVPTAWPDS